MITMLINQEYQWELRQIEADHAHLQFEKNISHLKFQEESEVGQIAQ